MRVLVTEKLSEAGLELLRQRFQVDVREDLAHGDLAAEIAPYDALVIRSATRVTADVLEAAPRLKVVARAGIGVDNVDVEAATRRGVMVVNAPQSNTISAAEHTMALLLAQARNIPQANSELHAGRWDRERWEGVELEGKTIGLIGLGRVGTLVASRAQGFGMRVIAFDPYVSAERAKELGVDVMPTLESLLVQSDFVSIHLPGSPDTQGLIGAHQLAMVKHGARLVNTSRGGIVDEEALAKALEDGRLAGAALDVFAVEPSTDSPLFGLDQVVVTPHLGASTVEAQDKAGTTVAEMVRLALEGQFVPYAVNVSAGRRGERGGPPVRRTRRTSRRARRRPGGRRRPLDRRVLPRQDRGARHQGADARDLEGHPRPVRERAGVVRERTDARPRPRHHGQRDALDRLPGLRESGVRPRARPSRSPTSRWRGPCLGKKNAERVIQVWDFEVEIEPARHMIFFVYEDRPGIIGKVGTILGEHDINIATMEVGRKAAGGDALMGLTVDSPVPTDVMRSVAAAIDAHTIRAITLDL